MPCGWHRPLPAPHTRGNPAPSGLPPRPLPATPTAIASDAGASPPLQGPPLPSTRGPGVSTPGSQHPPQAVPAVRTRQHHGRLTCPLESGTQGWKLTGPIRGPQPWLPNDWRRRRVRDGHPTCPLGVRPPPGGSPDAAYSALRPHSRRPRSELAPVPRGLPSFCRCTGLAGVHSPPAHRAFPSQDSALPGPRWGVQVAPPCVTCHLAARPQSSPSPNTGLPGPAASGHRPSGGPCRSRLRQDTPDRTAPLPAGEEAPSGPAALDPPSPAADARPVVAGSFPTQGPSQSCPHRVPPQVSWLWRPCVWLPQ